MYAESCVNCVYTHAFKNNDWENKSLEFGVIYVFLHLLDFLQSACIFLKIFSVFIPVMKVTQAYCKNFRKYSTKFIL